MVALDIVCRYLTALIIIHNNGDIIMSSKILAGLIAEVLQTGDEKKLPEDEGSRFRREFEMEVAEEVEQLRTQKRRAYEELKNIAVM